MSRIWLMHCPFFLQQVVSDEFCDCFYMARLLQMDVKYLPNSWIISPFILGNISTAFLTSKSPLSQLRSFSETGRCACPYYIMQAHRFSNRLKTSLWGNKSKKSSISIASTYLFVKSKLYIECPVTPFQCPFFHVNFQFWLQSSLFYIFGSYYSAYQVSSFRFFLH